MSKRPYFKTAQSVVSYFDNNPGMTSVEIGQKLGLHHAYVRQALKRNGRKLQRSYGRRQSNREAAQ